jgi:hypothetical protein
MGYVTKTESFDGNMVCHTFESYDDFVKFSKKDEPVSPVISNEENCSEGQYTLTLDEHELYTLRILLGHCLGDECSSINSELDEMSNYDLDCYDYDRLYFQHGETVVIKFK